ncbi:MAG: calcium/sodium antiporter [Endozoicomonas sp. (ex Botrylloides leachii)]|nr:calcium/sodium antiporter [Endozoicomonas sp. (ex Botrylloides leachii)]
MILAIFAITLGFIALTLSADRFVTGAVAIARQWHISPMLIGLTVVSIGTSAPEILVSIMAAAQGHADIAVGNAIGSNIANIGLVLGITALIAPLVIKKKLAHREIPWLVLVTLTAGASMIDGYLGRLDSLLLIILLVLTMYLMFRWQSDQPDEIPDEISLSEKLTKRSAWLHLIGGLIILLSSSHLLVWGAVHAAKIMGVSQLVIGLTIVAIGTSLPELAASVMSALRNQHDIALGNIAGSNIFNLLAVFAIPGIISPGHLDSAVIMRDYPVMLGLTLLLALWVISKKTHRISRWAGVFFLMCFIAYEIGLYIQLS